MNENEVIVRIELANIEPSPGNRRVGGIDQAKLEQLAASIQAVGVLHPILVREKKGIPLTGVPDYELVAGERRWRALRMLLNPPADPGFFSMDTTGGEFVVRVFCGEVTRTPTVVLDGRYFVAN